MAPTPRRSEFFGRVADGMAAGPEMGPFQLSEKFDRPGENFLPDLRSKVPRVGRDRIHAMDKPLDSYWVFFERPSGCNWNEVCVESPPGGESCSDAFGLPSG